jgi:hypothetical protein
VQTLKRQTASLEIELQASAPEQNSVDSRPDLEPGTSVRSAPDLGDRDTTFVAVLPAGNQAELSDLAAVTSELEFLDRELAVARARREQAECDLQTTLASLSLHSPAAAWSADPARLVARLGGTPRMLTVSLAMFASLIAGALMFRATRVLDAPLLLQTAGELASALPIPLVGRARLPGARRGAPSQGRSAIVTPPRVRLVTALAEAMLLTILGVCLVVIALDTTLIGQFANDPFGVLAEIVGRCLGR